MLFGLIISLIGLMICYDFIKPKIIVISIEGNIGSGKSTILNIMKKRWTDLIISPEPLAIWLNMKNNDGKNILETFYNNRQRWSYTLQNFAYITRLKMLQDTIKIRNILKTNIFKYSWSCLMREPIIVVTERSILTDRYVFAKMLHDNNDMTDLEMKMYLTWFDYFGASYKIDGIIYLHNSSECSMNRIKKRGRIEETNIDIGYLNELDKYHMEWLKEWGKENKVLELDTELDFESLSFGSQLRLESHLTKIVKFVKSL